MNISRTDVDALNAVIRITVDRNDHAEKVEKVLKDYRKNANIPGFRKGHVPMGLIKKQYQAAVTADEVNKLLQENLESYIKEEKLELLGNPLPKTMDGTLDWNADAVDFDFELGLAPKVEVDLNVLKKVTQHVIVPDKKMIQEQLEYLQKQYGKLVSQTKVQAGFEITAQFKNSEGEVDTMGTFTVEDIKEKANQKTLKAATIGTPFELPTQSLFVEDVVAKRILQIDDTKLNALNGNFEIEIKEINERVLAELNQALFDKLYEPGTVTSEAGLKDKIKAGMEQQFEPQSNQKLLNDIKECLVDKTSFDLPSDFLKRWMQTSGKNPLTAAQAEEEFNRSEKGIRYQLIEGQLIQENDLQLQLDELKDYTGNLIRGQMAQYGQSNPSQKELDETVARVLSNQEEVKRLSDQLMSQKLLNFYKEKAPLKRKEISFDAFIKEAYGNS